MGLLSGLWRGGCDSSLEPKQRSASFSGAAGQAHGGRGEEKGNEGRGKTKSWDAPYNPGGQIFARSHGEERSLRWDFLWNHGEKSPCLRVLYGREEEESVLAARLSPASASCQGRPQAELALPAHSRDITQLLREPEKLPCSHEVPSAFRSGSGTWSR